MTAAPRVEDPLRISAVIPTFNREALVARAIESALGQSRPPDEVIVVDDGSTDGTEARVAVFGDRVRYVRQANQGGASARNHGVEHATGEWIAFLDSDDVWTDGHLERMEAAVLATKGAAGFYFADTERTEAEGGARLWQLAGLAIQGPFELRRDGTAWVMLARQPMMLQSSVFRRSAYLAAGGLPPELSRRHDTHLFFRLGLGGPVCAVAGVGVRMTSDDDSAVRLTTSWDGRSEVYWRCSTVLYAAAARQAPTAAARRRLRAELATSHWRLSRRFWTERRRAAALKHVAKSVVASPVQVARIVTRAAGPGRRKVDRRAEPGHVTAGADRSPRERTPS